MKYVSFTSPLLESRVDANINTTNTESFHYIIHTITKAGLNSPSISSMLTVGISNFDSIITTFPDSPFIREKACSTQMAK
jgi:hypothetical protein